MMSYGPKLLNLWSRVSNYVTVGLLITTIVASTGWYITGLKLDNVRNLRETDKKTYVAAQAEYTAKATREKMEKEKIDNERAAKADAAYDTLLAQYRANLRVYKSTRSAYSFDNLPSATPAPEGTDGPGGGSQLPAPFYGANPKQVGDLLIIPTQDADICAINTARLLSARPWALTVKAENEAQVGVVP